MNKVITILGCGWLGKPLAIYLIESGYKVIGTTTSIEKLVQLKKFEISPVLFLLENRNTWETSITNSEILIIAIPSKNVEAFKKLSKFLTNTAVKKIIFVSSTSVYPEINGYVEEKTTVKNIPLVEIENIFLTSKQFKTTVVRFAGLFGYDRKPGNFFKDRPIPNPNGFVNMIHQDDCIELIKKIIEKDFFGGIFNGVADTHPTRREFYTKAAEAIGKITPVFIENETENFKIVNNKKSKEKLHFSYKYSDLLTSIKLN